MKRFQLFSLASAMLLASAAGFTSCSSDSEDPLDGGSGVAGQVVKTQFALNIPYGGDGSSTNQAKQGTRMTSNITQQNKDFRGISDILLLTFTGDPITTQNADKIHVIGEDNNAYDKDNYRRLYRDIEIPLGTDYMIFYGRAKKGTDSQPFRDGKITNISSYDTENALSKREFSLTPITNVSFANDTQAKEIIDALNSVANTKFTTDDGGVPKVYNWSTIGNSEYDGTNQPSWITKTEREFLKKNYESFIKLTAGSPNSVKATLLELQRVIKGEGNSADISKKNLTKAIYDNCTNALTKIGSCTFPRNLNLPDGVAKVTWNNTNNKFEYVAAENTAIGAGNNINYNKICYPAELSYFVKTKTMISDKEMATVTDFPKYDDWTTNLNKAWPSGGAFSEDAVKNTTRTVALKEPVQYSVALLNSTIKCADATLKDNAKQIVNNGIQEDQDISVPTNGFKVTAILVGGQPKTVDWKYDAKTGTEFDHTIYDKEMNGSILATNGKASNSNYTIVFDNRNNTEGAKQAKVYVTVELENNSTQAFYGADGLIPVNSKFYLVGTLDPNGSSTDGVNKPSGSTIDNVFVKDHVTNANFTIKNLKKAYNCIPDLRTSGINVGLAVDLSWQDGIKFDVNL